MGKDVSMYPSQGESTHAARQTEAMQQVYEEILDDVFPESHRESMGSSNGDGSSFLDPPPIYGPLAPNLTGTVGYDGRVDFDMSSTALRLSKLFASGLRKEDESGHDDDRPPPFSPAPGLIARLLPTPKLNIVMQVVGSRGDVQPFVSLGLTLQKFGHRVRLATHPTFQRFVEGMGLEFFSIGGDPAELMAYMVKNPGLMPGFDTFRRGEVQRRRRAMRDIMRCCWRSCYETGNGLDDHTSGSATNRNDGVSDGVRYREPQPFVADAIIANPPSFAHVHCAEKLGIPLHLMFTMPWSPTQAFAHPLANVRSSVSDLKVANYLSYIFVEMMTWQGLGDVINRFRYKTLGLERIHPTWAPGMISRLRIPYTYCWSPALIPKPKDWSSNITVAGFFFLPLASAYNAPPELLSFLDNGPPPVYIGFGSIVVEHPDALTEVVLEAIRLAGVRAIISKGWSNLGQTENATNAPSNVFMLGDCPHDWLFTRVSCVVHHGGAGTTAAGIAAGKPTVVVPFFGDQPFWGNMIYRAGAGPPPIPSKVLTATALADAISAATEPGIRRNANRLGDRVRQERGPEQGAQSFHEQLPLTVMQCALAPRRVAVWRHRKRGTGLSAMAASVLRKEGLVDFSDLETYRPCEYDLNVGPWEPLSGGTLAVLDLFYDTFKGIGEIGSEFVHVPYVGQKRTEKSAELVESPAHEPVAAELLPASPSYPPAQVSRDFNETIVGFRAAKGFGRIFKAAARAPGTFAAAMAQGAHNAPRMWGDKTVRQPDKITGVVSGLSAGCKELALGTYDGIAGFITQPVIGAMEEGPLGFVKGFGKGVVGLPFKFLAAMSGIVGYPLKGVDVGVTNAFKADSVKSIKGSRIAQGEKEYLDASEKERREVLDRWHGVLAEERFRKAEGKRKGKERAGTVNDESSSPGSAGET